MENGDIDCRVSYFALYISKVVVNKNGSAAYSKLDLRFLVVDDVLNGFL